MRNNVSPRFNGAKRGVKVFVELSTGMVYKPDSQPSKEGDKTKPWSKIAVFKLQAEEQLSKIEGWVRFQKSDYAELGSLLGHWANFSDREFPSTIFRLSLFLKLF